MNVNNATRDGLMQNGVAVEIPLPGGGRAAFPIWPHSVTSDEFTPESRGKADPKSRTFADPDPSTSRVPDLTAANRVLAERVAAINADRTLSAEGKRQAIDAAATETMANGVGKVFNDLAAVGARLQAEQAALFAVPKVTAESAHADVELRNHFRGLSEAERAGLVNHLDQPQHAPMLEALLRSPVPLDERTGALVQTAWAKKVALAKPAEAHRLGKALANHEWASNFASFMAQRIARAVWPVGDSRGFDHQKAYEALRGVKATKALALDAQQEMVLEHRAALAEARAKSSAA